MGVQVKRVSSTSTKPGGNKSPAGILREVLTREKESTTTEFSPHDRFMVQHCELECLIRKIRALFLEDRRPTRSAVRNALYSQFSPCYISSQFQNDEQEFPHKTLYNYLHDEGIQSVKLWCYERGLNVTSETRPPHNRYMRFDTTIACFKAILEEKSTDRLKDSQLIDLVASGIRIDAEVMIILRFRQGNILKYRATEPVIYVELNYKLDRAKRMAGLVIKELEGESSMKYPANHCYSCQDSGCQHFKKGTPLRLDSDSAEELKRDFYSSYKFALEDLFGFLEGLEKEKETG